MRKKKSVFIKAIGRNQLTIFVLALICVSGAYIMYEPERDAQLTSTTLDNSMLADIGDAVFVSESGIVEEIETAQNEIKAVQASANVVSEEDVVDDNEKVEEAETEEVSAETTDYYINSKMDRDIIYSEILESYEKILENDSVSAEQKAEAVDEITEINETKNAIMISENLIKNKGFDDVVVFVNEYSVSVVIRKDELTAEEVAQIQNIITRELDVEVEQVNISTR